jgi:hypothetical protein
MTDQSVRNCVIGNSLVKTKGILGWRSRDPFSLCLLGAWGTGISWGSMNTMWTFLEYSVIVDKIYYIKSPGCGLAAGHFF